MTPFESALLAPQPHIGIIGLGYVGLPLALRFAEVGLKVTGFDVDPAKPAKLAAGESYINYIPAESLRAAAAAFSLASSPLPQAARARPRAIMTAPARLFRTMFATSCPLGRRGGGAARHSFRSPVPGAPVISR